MQLQYTTKRCPNCGETKPLSEYHKNKQAKCGVQGECKQCRNRRTHEYSRDPDVAQKIRERNRKYREQGRYTDYKRAQPESPEAARAHAAVRRAVKRGDLPRISECTCVKCGAPAMHRHHHKGYAVEHRLDVIPLCQSCHQLEHSPHT